MQVHSVESNGLAKALQTVQRGLDRANAKALTAENRQEPHLLDAATRAAESRDAKLDAKEIPSGEERVPGVIRNLEAGRFKGVADVRLRINFFDELAARQQESAKPEIEAASANFLTAVGDSFDALISSLDLDQETKETIEGLFAEFQESIAGQSGDLATTLAGGGSLDAASLEGAVRSIFETLVAQLSEVLAPPSPEPDAEPEPADGLGDTLNAPADIAITEKAAATDSIEDTQPVAIDPVSTEPEPVAVDPGGTEEEAAPIADEPAEPATTAISYEDALASLQNAFDVALSQLLTVIDTSTQLSDPAPYTGNGSAYDKFLSIYDALRNAEPVVDEQA